MVGGKGQEKNIIKSLSQADKKALLKDGHQVTFLTFFPVFIFSEFILLLIDK